MYDLTIERKQQNIKRECVNAIWRITRNHAGSLLADVHCREISDRVDLCCQLLDRLVEQVRRDQREHKAQVRAERKAAKAERDALQKQLDGVRRITVLTNAAGIEALYVNGQMDGPPHGKPLVHAADIEEAAGGETCRFEWNVVDFEHDEWPTRLEDALKNPEVEAETKTEEPANVSGK